MTRMTVTAEPSVTTGPIAGSSKAYRNIPLSSAGGPVGRVPFRRVNLSNGQKIGLYNTSGPHADPDAVIDVTAGLSARAGVVHYRGTSLRRARAGDISAEMAF